MLPPHPPGPGPHLLLPSGHAGPAPFSNLENSLYFRPAFKECVWGWGGGFSSESMMCFMEEKRAAGSWN